MGEKDPLEMSADEQIEAGKSFKEFSSLLNEVVDGMGWDNPFGDLAHIGILELRR